MRRIIVLGCCLVLSVNAVFSQKKEDILKYIDTYKELAISEMQRTGVPASITLSQGIHETMAGTSDLVLKSNNHFGIKCKTGWTGDKVFHDDDARGECFRSYAKAEDSYKDHSNYLKNTPRYAFLFQLDPEDYQSWAYGLKKAGYATNIRYSQILIKFIQDYNLEQYTLIALGKLKPSDEAVAATAKDEPISMDDRNATTAKVIGVLTTKPTVTTTPAPEITYPSGQFTINNTKVIFAQAGSSWLAIAEKYSIPLATLLDFNDLKSEVPIQQPGQLVYIQRKRKVGSAESHTVKQGETMYTIAQKEGIRLDALQDLNSLYEGMEPAPGQQLNLQSQAAKRPLLIGEK